VDRKKRPRTLADRYTFTNQDVLAGGEDSYENTGGGKKRGIPP